MSDKVLSDKAGPEQRRSQEPVVLCVQQLSRRCPKLGHDLEFAYCERENAGSPCAKALVCWNEAFDVRRQFLASLSAEDFDASFAKAPQTKALSLLDLIERAKRLRSAD